MTSYITSDDLKATLTMAGETYADADITLAISTASNVIDGITGRRFTLDTGNTTQRFYTPSSPWLVSIDDLAVCTEVATGPGDGTFPVVWTPDTQYFLEPLNAPADGEPYTAIRAVNARFITPGLSVGGGRFRRTVRVTGQYGWPEIPDALKLATSLLATRLMRRMREAPFGVVQMGIDGAAARIARTDPDLQLVLGDLTRLLVD